MAHPPFPPPRHRALQPSSLEWPLEHLPGLSAGDRTALAGLGYTTTAHLLARANTRAGQRAIAQQLNLHEHHVRKWAALADLARVPGVGCQFCGLLLHAGIISVAELAQAQAPRLHHQILRLQVSELRRRDLAPGASQIAAWIAQARQLLAHDRSATHAAAPGRRPGA